MSIVSAILAFFKKRTVSTIVADLEQKVEHLAQVVQARAIEEERHLAEISERSKAVAETRKEVARAKSISSKLAELLA